MSFDEEYFCPNCDATLNDQPGFDPDLGTWTCTNCGKELYGDSIASSMGRFDGVVWHCDSCGAVLNKQCGFTDYCDTWVCTECGHENPINEDEIRESSYSESTDDSIGTTGSGVVDFFLSRAMRREEERRLELMEEQRKARKRAKREAYYEKHKKRIWITRIVVFLLVIGTLKYFDIKNAISIGYSSNEVEGLERKAVAEQLTDSGFWTVWYSAVYDIDIEDIELDGKIIDMKVNGKESFKETSRFPPFSLIVIHYHSLKEITVPMSAKDAEGMDYHDVVAAFEDAGFISIRCETKPDLVTGWITKENSVDSITIDGSSSFSSERTARPDAEVVITYHTFKNK